MAQNTNPCGPSLTESEFLRGLFPTQDQRQLCPWCWLQRKVVRHQRIQQAFVQRREQRAEGTFPVKLPVEAFLLPCRLPGLVQVDGLSGLGLRSVPAVGGKDGCSSRQGGMVRSCQKGTRAHFHTVREHGYKDACAHVWLKRHHRLTRWIPPQTHTPATSSQLHWSLQV